VLNLYEFSKVKSKVEALSESLDQAQNEEPLSYHFAMYRGDKVRSLRLSLGICFLMRKRTGTDVRS